MFKYEFAANLPTTLSAKNFENRLTSGEVVGKSLVSLTHGVAYILIYNDRTVTHLHIKWVVALGPIVVGAGTRHLPPSRIHAPETNPR